MLLKGRLSSLTAQPWKCLRFFRRHSRNCRRQARTLSGPRLEVLEDRVLLSVDSPAVELFNTSSALFVENQGQWEDESVRYAFFGSGANVLYTDSGPLFQLFQTEQTDQTVDELPQQPGAMPWELPELGEPEEVAVELTEFSVSFDGANVTGPVGLNQAETVYNYYVGEESTWRTAVPSYETVAYLDLYDGIDLLTSSEPDSLKYEFRIAAGADYRQIQVSYEGIDRLWLDDAGAMHIETELGELVDEAPFVFQQIDGETVEVAGRF